MQIFNWIEDKCMSFSAKHDWKSISFYTILVRSALKYFKIRIIINLFNILQQFSTFHIYLLLIITSFYEYACFSGKVIWCSVIFKFLYSMSTETAMTYLVVKLKENLNQWFIYIRIRLILNRLCMLIKGNSSKYEAMTIWYLDPNLTQRMGDFMLILAT